LLRSDCLLDQFRLPWRPWDESTSFSYYASLAVRLPAFYFSRFWFPPTSIHKALLTGSSNIRMEMVQDCLLGTRGWPSSSERFLALVGVVWPESQEKYLYCKTWVISKHNRLANNYSKWLSIWSRGIIQLKRVCRLILTVVRVWSFMKKKK